MNFLRQALNKLLGKLRPARDAVPPDPPSDPIDEASWESFPASDPPAIGQSGTRPSLRSAASTRAR